MAQRRRLKIYFDGGCRPNPGIIEAAVVVRGVTYFFDDLGYGTSSDAEWTALRLSLELAQSLDAPEFDLIGDSAEVIGQATGAAPPRSAASVKHLTLFRQQAAKAPPRRIVWTPRQQNLAGIALARRRAF
ncbi:ribonuclease HI [Erythrobacter sp. R86502]|uniref:ribonuclease HI n=1 Tax=Erythrobacter sp. R86502 TaxID=3093846 RepID=UPI0036D3CE7B